MNLRRAKFVAAFVVVGVLVVFGITFAASPTPKVCPQRPTRINLS